MPVNMTPKALQEQFVVSTKAWFAAKKAVQPLVEQRDKLVAQIQALEAKLRPIEGQIEKAEAPVKELQRERAMISRALGGKVPIVEEEEAELEKGQK